MGWGGGEGTGWEAIYGITGCVRSVCVAEQQTA